MKKAVFPGSFDPITLGHEDVISRAIPLFDEIYIAIGINSNKKYMFSLDQRKKFIEECFQEYKNVKVITYKGLTVDLCKKHDIDYIIRGLRNPADFEFEKAIAHTNTRHVAKKSGIWLSNSSMTFFSHNLEASKIPSRPLVPAPI